MIGYEWKEMRELAQQDDGTSLLDGLSGWGAVAFDGVKEDVCACRVSALNSVDALRIGKDGRIYFIEFKKTLKNPIADLRRKAFDSLSVFWLSLGERLSMSSICERAVFVYVKSDAQISRPSAENALMNLLEMDAPSLRPARAKSKLGGEQLDGLKADGLYADVMVLGATQFRTRLAAWFDAEDSAAFKRRLEGLSTPSPVDSAGPRTEEQSFVSPLNDILLCARAAQGGSGGAFCETPIHAVDFRKLAGKLLAMRMYRHDIERDSDAAGDLCCADAMVVEAGHERLISYADLGRAKRKLVRIVNVPFDSFYLWAWCCHPDESCARLRGRPAYELIFDGEMLCWPRPHHVWLQDFYELYSPWFERESCDLEGRQIRFGLAYFKDEMTMYGDVVTREFESLRGESMATIKRFAEIEA